MVTYEAFADLVDEIAGSLPEAFFRDLNGGVNVKEECRIHPESLHNELIILGEYCTDPYLGRMIHIYYGSFMRLYGTLDPGALKERVRKTVLHEFRHHLETMAGENGLAVQDALELADYRRRRLKQKTVWNPEDSKKPEPGK